MAQFPGPVPPESRLKGLWLKVLVTVLCVLLVAPSLVVMPMSFSGSKFLQFPPEAWSTQWYDAYFASIEWREATWISLRAAILTVLVATPIGTMAAYGLHVSNSKLATFIGLLLIMPLMVPIILIAVGVFFLYARMGLNNTLAGLVLAHSVLAIPFVLITVTAGLKSYDMNQELVARSLGANRLKAFFNVTLPQIRLSVFSGALFAFITSLDEVVVAIFIARGDSSTLPRRMFSFLRDQVDPTSAAISTLLIVISIILLIVNLTLQSSEKQEH
ncbi:putative spermidine/putrescine transport system permease protein [Ruegeria halocynthiae]|uniref:Putative spermidine/putrescine transport system permease protein n=1 Tax=Ruegeria halocynthiae TaxID=985054 RepID=A0A1H2YHA9_9RHOB|nr:ABC transporter permease [Ruegeria halocynthiae]SDX04556.1 putative spermidine/putrescine transport system permease protein [Ruegeria halocynthiae]